MKPITLRKIICYMFGHKMVSDTVKLGTVHWGKETCVRCKCYSIYDFNNVKEIANTL